MYVNMYYYTAYIHLSFVPHVAHYMLEHCDENVYVNMYYYIHSPVFSAPCSPLSVRTLYYYTTYIVSNEPIW